MMSYFSLKSIAYCIYAGTRSKVADMSASDN